MEIKTKPASLGNLQANATIEIIHQVLGNRLRTLHMIYNKHMQIILTHGWASQWQQIFRYEVRTTRLNKNSVPINFWTRHDTPNQSYRKLEIHTPAEEQKYLICEKSTRINYNSNIVDKSWSKGTRFINTKRCFKVCMNHQNVDERNHYYTNGRGRSLNIRHIKPYNSP